MRHSPNCNTAIGLCHCNPVESETLEQERQRVFGTCGGECGEAPCIAWNKENDRKKAHRERRDDR